MDLIHGSSRVALEDSLRFRVARGGVLAANIANVDTPGYRRRDLAFEESLNDALIGLERTSDSHVPSRAPADRYRVEVGPKGTRPDGNGVDLDREIVALHRNSGGFVSRATILARLSSITRTAITGG